MMSELFMIIQGIVERGLIFGVLVAAVFLASRLINFDNLAAEGAFGLGGALTAFIINQTLNPWISVGASILAGALSGLATGLLNTKLKLNSLISGIIIATGLFSIILKIAGSNMSLQNNPTIFTLLPLWVAPYQALFLLTILVTALFLTISWFLKTEVGYLLHAVGDAPQMLTNIGKSVDGYTMLGLTLSNALAALSGGLFVQYAGYFSIWSGIGILIMGLAGMIIAQTFSSYFGASIVFGSIAYQAIVALTFELQLDQDWNKLITALLIIILIVIKQQLNKK